VYEQHLSIINDPTESDPLKPWMPKLVRGKMRSAPGDPNLIITLTEVEYRDSTSFQCRPPAACRYDDGSSSKEETKGREAQLPRFVIGIR